MNGWRTLFPNAWYIAAREYRGRIASRSFLLGTILLAVIAFAATESPVLIDYLQGTSQTSVAVYTTVANLPADAQQVLDSQLNPQTETSNGHKEFAISWFDGSGDNESNVQQDLDEGQYAALLAIDRNAQTGDLTFTLRTDMPSDGRQVGMLQNAVTYLALDDRLARAGVSIAALQTPPAWSVVPLKSGSADEGNAKTTSVSGEITSTVLSTVLIVLMLMAIITYGTWVAMSVGEEKGSRVMELMLNATTPLQMLAGKMIGNGAAGLTQYGIILAAVIGGLLAQGPVHKAIVGTASSEQFGGLSPMVLGAFVVLFVLGFTLYSLFYAALGSLVSRQEDVQSATSPLMMLIIAGYVMSVFGLQAIEASVGIGDRSGCRLADGSGWHERRAGNRAAAHWSNPSTRAVPGFTARFAGRRSPDRAPSHGAARRGAGAPTAQSHVWQKDEDWARCAPR